MDDKAHQIARLANELRDHQRLCNRCFQGIFCWEVHRLRIQMNDLEREGQGKRPQDGP
ncbi:MAG: hypothetical protein GWN58_58035 [Anaerolineae bacterium]|nr:hypothetical protein [Anaerolineae bacterium]